MAEDLLGVALVAAAGGAATVGRPQQDKGIDLYVRRLRSMLTFPIQVKASLTVSPDGTATHDIPEADLRALSGGYLAVVHIPAPHDQLYPRLFLIPDDEFRKRSDPVTAHRVPSFRFTAQFAGPVDPTWSPFSIDIDHLSDWFAAIPGWSAPVVSLPLTPSELSKAENHDIAAIGSFWVSSELERSGMGRIMIIEDRVRMDPVTILVHDLHTQRFAGVHLRTAIFNRTRRIHFDVKKHHFFIDGQLWVALVLLRRDLKVHDYCLLIPSADIPSVGFSETLTLDPLTKRFQKYQVPSEEFGPRLMQIAFGGARKNTHSSWKLPKAS